MPYTVLSRKYRPQTFDEVMGQEHIATALKNAISSDRVAHAYLFAGPRGVGKTSMARILAKALNCVKGPTPNPCGKCEICRSIATGEDLDVLEIDGASNRGIDEARAIRGSVAYRPARARTKVYYIDEAHQVTRDGFNALLKTLEEPPEHVKFIFATTEPHKMPPTIQSRCQRFDFRLLPSEMIAGRLTRMCKNEGAKAEAAALRLIADMAEGSVRDAESLLDQLISFCEKEITVDDVLRVTGRVSVATLFEVVERLKARDAKGAIESIDRVLTGGSDPGAFLNQLLGHVRDLLVVVTCGPDRKLLQHEESDLQKLQAQADGFSENTLMYMIQILGEARKNLRANLPDRIVLETALIKLARMEDLRSMDELLFEASRLLGEVPGSQKPPLVTESPSPKWTPAPPSQPASGREKPAGAGQNWGNVVAMVCERKRSVGEFLGEGEVASIGDGKIVVRLSSPFHKARIEEPANKRLVKKCVESVFGPGYEVTLVLEEKKVESRRAGADEPGRAGAAETPRGAAARKAAEMFEGRIVREKR